MSTTRTPEIGQLVEVRGLPWLVQDVHPGARDGREIRNHRVTLQALGGSSDLQELTVIWEHEVHPRIDDAQGLPELRPDEWDPLEWFQALLLATRWSSASQLDALPIQSPFRGAIQLEEYQLEPVARAVEMPRVKLLIADFVGAGKTIEAGLVVRELIARQRARRMLILCPASLQQQWAEEMREKFGLRFEIIDRARVLELQREYGIHVNPWSSYPRLITSMDYLKRRDPLRTFVADLQIGGSGGLRRRWDLLVVDEVHNCVPQGKGQYVQDSDRTRMLREVLDHFEHRLFLTATPHNGYTESFTALLEMLDPLRFQRGPIVDRETFERNRQHVMVRRVKEEIVRDDGRRVLPVRDVDDHWSVRLTEEETALHDDLQAYVRQRKAQQGGERTAVRFVLTLLKKRLLSSPRAFVNSLRVHLQHMNPTEEVDPAVFQRILRELRQDEEDDDERRAQREEEAVAEASGLFRCAPAELGLVERMRARAETLGEGADSKASVLMDWIRNHLFEGKGKTRRWLDRRLVVFTEYRDTLQYLFELMDAAGWSDAVLRIWGGMPLGERRAVQAAFTSPPSANPARILLATDAASEGLNLQAHCDELVHYEIPWNPNRMEQRNGRIDRKGQPAEIVHCRHFVFEGRQDQEFLDVIVNKVRAQRNDLGAVSEVLAARVERAMLGDTDTVEDDPALVEAQRVDLGVRKLVGDEELRSVWRRRAGELHDQLVHARAAWRLTPDSMRQVIDAAMRASKDGGLEAVAEGALADAGWWARDVPWPDCWSAVRDEQGNRRVLVFDPEHAWSDRGVARAGVSLVHLDHPLMLRALSFFRRQLWASGFGPDAELSRATYKVVPRQDVSGMHLIVIARLVAHNRAGRKVHEELSWVGGRLRGGEVEWKEPAELEALVWGAGTWPSLSVELGATLRRLYIASRPGLEKQLEELRASHAKDVRILLAERGRTDAKEVRALIRERIAEVERSIAEAGKKTRQLEMDFGEAADPEAVRQWRDDKEWLEHRLAELKLQREEEPARLEAEHAVRAQDVMAFPVGVLFVLPDDTPGITGKHDRSQGAVTHTEMYSLLRQLELLLRAAIRARHADGAWEGHLSDDRRAKAHELFEKKVAAGTESALEDCLYLDDLFTILRKSAEVRAALGLTDQSGKELKAKGNVLGRVRDAVMHHEDLSAPARGLSELPGIREELVLLLDAMQAAWERSSSR